MISQYVLEEDRPEEPKSAKRPPPTIARLLPEEHPMSLLVVRADTPWYYQKTSLKRPFECQLDQPAADSLEFLQEVMTHYRTGASRQDVIRWALEFATSHVYGFEEARADQDGDHS